MRMIDYLNLYFRYIGISVRAQMQYKASFIMATFGNLLMSAVEFFAIWALFDRFGTIRGWTLPEVAMFYGIVNTAFSISEAGVRGFDMLPNLVKSGEFDRILLRPRSAAFQVASLELQLLRIGKFVQGIVVLAWALSAVDVAWTLPKALLLVGAIGGGVCIFSGFFILEATLSFWTTETLEIVNAITYGGVETAQYPLVIYRDWFRRFFTYVIPLALVNYFPALAILNRPDPLGTPEIIKWASPLLGLIFLMVTLQIWKIGVRHYTSTGS